MNMGAGEATASPILYTKNFGRTTNSLSTPQKEDERKEEKEMATTKLQAIGKTSEGKTATSTILELDDYQFTQNDVDAIGTVLQPLITYPITTMRVISTEDFEPEISGSEGTDYLTSEDVLRLTYTLEDSSTQTRSISHCATPSDTSTAALAAYKALVTSLKNEIKTITSNGAVMTGAVIRSTTDYNVDPESN